MKTKKNNPSIQKGRINQVEVASMEEGFPEE
jgi:hypothetical protein